LLVQYSRLYSSARYNESDTPKESTWYPVQCHAHSLTCLLVVNSEVADGERVAVERWGRPGEPHPVGGNIPNQWIATPGSTVAEIEIGTLYFRKVPESTMPQASATLLESADMVKHVLTVDFELQIFISCHKYFVEWD